MANQFLLVCASPLDLAAPTLAGACPSAYSLPVDAAQLSAGLVTVSVDRTHNQESYDDMGLMFGAFVVVLISIWGAKQLLRLFTSDPER